MNNDMFTTEIEKRLERIAQQRAAFARAPRWTKHNRKGLSQDDCVRISTRLDAAEHELRTLLAWVAAHDCAAA